MLTVRRLPEEVHRALMSRAERHGHSMEAEVREILSQAVLGSSRMKLGSLLRDIGRDVALTPEEAKLFENIRDKTPAGSVNFS